MPSEAESRRGSIISMRRVRVRRLTVIAWANVITCLVSVTALYFVVRYPITERRDISDIQQRVDKLEQASKVKDYLLVQWMPLAVKNSLSPRVRADLGIK